MGRASACREMRLLCVSASDALTAAACGAGPCEDASRLYHVDGPSGSAQPGQGLQGNGAIRAYLRHLVRCSHPVLLAVHEVALQ
jgi:hypothetical protein